MCHSVYREPVGGARLSQEALNLAGARYWGLVWSGTVSSFCLPHFCCFNFSLLLISITVKKLFCFNIGF